MQFRNHTPFPALLFEGIDQHERGFHVLVLRQTLSFATGELKYAKVQAPLCEVDTFFGDMNASSLRQESDLCQFKPKCDILVHATAHAPRAVPVRRFDVRVRVLAAPTTSAQRGTESRRLLLDKTLSVTGERSFRKRRWPLSLLISALKLCSFGLVNINPWRLTAPAKFTSMPLRYENAFGGQCRINAADKAAKRVAKRHRLDSARLAEHPDRDLPREQQAVAHAAYEHNIAGCGFSTAWYLRAKKCARVPAPRVEHPDAPLTGKLFWQVQRGKFNDARSLPRALDPAGLGIRAKAHPARRALLGTVDSAFIQSKSWLPLDFDFAIWNAAPPDQQLAYLRNDETIELTNLCARDAPGAQVDEQGNTVLRLPLPKHECFALLRLHSGELVRHPLAIDTVIVEPGQQTLTLVWRMVVEKQEPATIRVCEARMQTHADREELERMMTRLTKPQQTDKAPAQPPLFHVHPEWNKVST